MKHVLIILSVLAAPALAWDDCPFGLVDDPAPGRCRLYVDANQDGICDRSQKQPQPAEDKPAPSVAGKISPGASAGGGTQSPSAARTSAAQPPQAMASTYSAEASVSIDPEPSDPPPKPAKPRPGRHAWPIILTTALLAVATEWLTAVKKELGFRLQSVWNWMLLVLFMLSAATGVYFILPNGGEPGLAVLLYHWHVETGLAFVAVGAYHALRRFACMLRGLGACFRRG
jgi:hypothetical protein